MKPISEAWCCQIDVNNRCHLDCAYCSRLLRHTRADQRFNMSLHDFRTALESLSGFPGKIGIIGGEPTLHPEFSKLCYAVQLSGISKATFGLFTSGGKGYDKHRGLIDETFGFVAMNKHTEEQKQACLHQPLTVGVDDVVKDEAYRQKLIENCWVQQQWCPSVNPKGAFFCEIAAAWDVILDGPGGWVVEPGWWKRSPENFADQINRYCGHCGMPVPMAREHLGVKEQISAGNLKLFNEHRLPLHDFVTVVSGSFTVEQMEAVKVNWDPGNYRGDIRNDRPYGHACAAGSSGRRP